MVGVLTAFVRVNDSTRVKVENWLVSLNRDCDRAVVKGGLELFDRLRVDVLDVDNVDFTLARVSSTLFSLCMVRIVSFQLLGVVFGVVHGSGLPSSVAALTFPFGIVDTVDKLLLRK